MKRTIGIALAIVMASGWAAIAATGKDVPTEIVIKDCQTKQPPVTFPHKTHADREACATCHHTQKDLKAGAAVEVEPCGKCHASPEKATTPKCAEMSTTKNPFHIKCMGCHKEAQKKDAKAKAPVKCAECHKK